MGPHAKPENNELLQRIAALERELAARKASGTEADLRPAEAALQEQEERLRAILETAVEGIITIDTKGIIESLNPAAERIFGYRAAELRGRNVKCLMPTPYQEAHDGYMHNYLSTGHAKIIGSGREVLGLRKDGSTFPMDLSVSEVRLADKRLFTGFVRDITDRKRSEEALSVSKERFQVALKNSPIFVFNQDAQLRYTWIHNSPIPDADRNVIGRTDEMLFPAEEADRLVQIKQRVLATGESMRQEVRCTIGKTTFVYDLTVEPVRDNAGQVVGLTGAATDVTEHKRLEKEVLQISELEQRRIGQDLHDGICQHLTGIELMSQVLEQNLAKRAKTHAAQAEKISGHVRDVINQTRSLARGLSPVVLESEGLMAALTELAASTEKLFPVKCHFVFDEPVLLHDLIASTHLYRIAQEAVTNAIKHGKASRIEIHLSVPQDKIVLSIADNGRGFSGKIGESKGMGLRIMQYRAGMIGATLLVQRQAAGGMNVVCILPKPGSAPTPAKP